MTGKSLIIILGMSFATYATRIAGFWLAGHKSYRAKLERWFRHIPGTVLIAMIVPETLSSGLTGLLALFATIIVMKRTHNLLLAMGAGMTVIATFRLTGLSCSLINPHP